MLKYMLSRHKNHIVSIFYIMCYILTMSNSFAL